MRGGLKQIYQIRILGTWEGEKNKGKKIDKGIVTKAFPRIKISDFKTYRVLNRTNKEGSHLDIIVKFKSNKDFKNLNLSRGKLDRFCTHIHTHTHIYTYIHIVTKEQNSVWHQTALSHTRCKKIIQQYFQKVAGEKKMMEIMLSNSEDVFSQSSSSPSPPHPILCQIPWFRLQKSLKCNIPVLFPVPGSYFIPR